MSINVTVSGNPVCIKRGKMVTACDSAKNEFDRRRLMRLEQVRQQSKDIAETVRNRLRKEKKKCLSEIEREGEVKLKNWQTRKLLDLQNQYQEALEEIGVGHKDAVRVEDEEELYLEQQASNEKIAKERGRAAAEQLQIDKNEESLRRAVPIQRKKIARDMENSRSSEVTGLRKVKQGKNYFKKKKKRQQAYDSDIENRVPQLLDLEDLDSLSSASLEIDDLKAPSVHKISKEQQTSQRFEVPKTDKAAQTLTQEEIPLTTTRDVPMDTRISEHIKRRSKMNHHLDYCDFVDKELPPSFNKTHCNCCQCPQRTELADRIPERQTIIRPSERPEENIYSKSAESGAGTHEVSRKNETVDKHSQQPITDTVSRSQQLLTEPISLEDTSKINFPKDARNPGEEERVTKTTDITSKINFPKDARNPGKEERVTKTTDKSSAKGQKPSTKNIPSKPKVVLKSTKDRIPHIMTADPSAKPVQYYDHPNRFSKQYIPPTSHVERIDEDSLRISPNVLSEEDIREKMRQRDIEAHVRGQVALEKERIQREYRELLKKLPVLQKQERIYEIGADKEKYHMSRDRLEEMEKRRQNRLDNAYEELFVRRKPATVTIPRRKTEAAPSLNLASWDVDFEPTSTVPDTESKDRTEQLNDLLVNLKAQKDSLVKEIENTLSKETLNELTKSSYENVKSMSTDYSQNKPKRKRNREERLPSPVSSDVNVGEKSDSKSKSTKKGTMSTVTSPSPRKKAKLKSRKKVLVLQNTSTQTTPKTGQSAATSPLTTTSMIEETERGKCVCPKEFLNDLCEIVIKIKEDERPEVTVNPPVLGKNVKVITEEKKPEESVLESSREQSTKKDEKSKESSVSKDESGRSKKSILSSKKSVRTSSWRESFTHSGSSQSTSSTSYFEPPSRPSGGVKTSGKPSEDVSKNSTLSNGSKKLDPRLLTYIKKLLNMSRASIDELGVSAASDVSTPPESVVETPTNNPLVQLKNVMKYFNLDFAELQKQLSYVSDESSFHYNTTESVTVSSTNSEGEKSAQFKSCTEIDSAERQETNSKLLQYADIAASCTKKISSLTAMIEKVREEKKKILQSPCTSSSMSDKEISTTSYLGLPDAKKNDDNLSSSSSQEDLSKKLLTIDYSYAERLKHLSSEEIQMEKKRVESENLTDENLLEKLKSLLQDGGGKTSVPEKTTAQLSKPEDKMEGEGKEKSPPLFLDIPKLPRLEAPSLEEETKKRRPPPSKGLRILGGPLPHELSTIVEADSQLSTRGESPTKGASPKSSSKSSSVPDILTEVPQHIEPKSQSTNSSEEVSEMETMETMLISIGMEWAIPTLKKTREALALSSSSGSGSQKDSGELSLREFLSRISSTSSSTLSDSQSQGVSLIQVDNRRTSTPILEAAKKEGQPVFPTDSDISSVREQSNDGSKTG